VDVVVDTEAVPPEERFGLWAEESARVFEPMRVTSPRRDGFRGRAWSRDLGPLTVYRVAADTSAIHRTPSLIAASDPQRLQLSVQVRGRCVVEQDGRRTEVRPGDVTTWESSRPYTVDARTPFELVNVFCPEHLLRPHTDRLYARTATRIPAHEPLGRILGALITEVVRGLHDGSVGQGDVAIAESVIALVRGMHDDTIRRPAAPADALRAQVRAHIAAHVADAGLTPDAIARAHFISRSYLDRLFEDEPRSVAETIRDARLEGSRRDLADPRLAGCTVLDIALSWGFTSAAHFSRAFRARYGMSPRDARGPSVKQECADGQAHAGPAD
jgi:AraC-like DNA-binding protein